MYYTILYITFFSILTENCLNTKIIGFSYQGDIKALRCLGGRFGGIKILLLLD